MAKLVGKEEELFAQIKKEALKVHPAIWKLLTHHVNNHLNVINVILGGTVMIDEALTKEDAKKITNRTKSIAEFLDELRETTEGTEQS